ncbi:glycine cleavage system protein H [Candidatus Micrarchaeota archaeon CG08_land_8_20_14_0_20_49_17]|nr:MAG: glycine cleavage system protein H [Candidatus Micrarchaeota archaeon CG1_02_49_24]PIU09983.1 MAG: glycine cleavage system protein H [Candidatus Micrarchaeota archaeon CG08_land_8_20_14_0_20_49_17]PIU82557.1 MAG: glycine cleavage system protein H [Candidatus Micrarchaeota archaeon CG06_land_8_20_14_3_00_50_6]PIZ98256.1 MAG: glycine cleavage system protein H [Candidatus Micrarchaeota archaeon CG_4_10_14_0_2_um_filter_49_7]HII53223.1 glycine cleavage system protein GcvH [Candidatus Micrarc
MKFTKEHEWINVEGDIGTVGITDYAQKQLGDIVSVELPKVGAKVKQFGRLALVDSMKASSDVYASVSGEVVAVNDGLSQNPQWVNESAEEKGWFAKIKLENQGELGNLMDKLAYDEFVKGIKH